MGTEYGDRGAALAGEILRTVVGSGVHGIAIPGTDDHDEMGVYIEPPEVVLGIGRSRDSYVWRTQPEGHRSGHGDTDLVMYPLARYLSLAIKGNPTVLVPLFAHERDILRITPLGRELREMRSEFLSQAAVERFLGYMHSQHERMMGGGKRNRVPNRPELVERHGWDVKYGSHSLRLALQGLEIAERGTLTLPMPDAERVLAVKRGERSREDVSAEIADIEARIRHLLDSGATALPATADHGRINAWAVAAQRSSWGW